MIRTHVVCAALTIAALVPGQLLAQDQAADPTEVASEQYTVEMENDAVRVLRVSYAPGAKSARHAHPGHVAILTTDGTYRVTGADGEVRDIAGKRGDAIWAPAGAHTIENPGEAQMDAILVEILPDESGAMMQEVSDPTEVASAQYSVILENDQVRVLRAAYEPGVETAMHRHPAMVAVLMSDGGWQSTDPTGEVLDVESQDGIVIWHDAHAHAMKNAGDSAGGAILVELK
jgi:quercetin dioxygenase-like cupin family protein